MTKDFDTPCHNAVKGIMEALELATTKKEIIGKLERKGGTHSFMGVKKDSVHAGHVNSLISKDGIDSPLLAFLSVHRANTFELDKEVVPFPGSGCFVMIAQGTATVCVYPVERVVGAGFTIETLGAYFTDKRFCNAVKDNMHAACINEGEAVYAPHGWMVFVSGAARDDEENTYVTAIVFLDTQRPFVQSTRVRTEV